MRTTQRILVALAIAAAHCCVVTFLFAAEPDEVEQLTEVLESDAPLHDKAVACERLAVVGTEETVAVLAELLDHPRLSHYARFALEPIPGPAVDQALRKALDELEGPLLVGVLHSVGHRQDEQAVGRLGELLEDADSEISAAAAAALGKIANPETVELLLKELGSESSAPQPAIADACLAAAERLLGRDQPERAIEIYRSVRQSELPERFRVAATYSAILTGGSESHELLLEQLESDDKAFFDVAVQAARVMDGEPVTRALLSKLDVQPPARRALLIQALGDRGDAAALPAVRDALQSENAAVQLAAIRSLRRVGDASVAAPLMEIASQSEDEVAAVAKETLAALPGEKVDQAFLQQWERDDPKARLLVIQLAGERRIESAVPKLLEAAESPMETMRLAAIRALGETLGLKDIGELVERVLSPASSQEQDVAERALTAACIRMPDREACVEKVAAQFAQASPEKQVFLFEMLREVGGQAALERVVAGARDADEQVQDGATRVLGEWLTADAAPELLELAKTLDSEKFRIRALRGYIRIIRQFGLGVDERVAMSQRALEAAERVEEKRLVLQALSRFPAVESLQLAVSQLETPGLKGPAANAAVAIAEQIGEDGGGTVRQAMRQVIQAGIGDALEDRARQLLE